MFGDWVPALVVIVATFVVVFGVRWFLQRNAGADGTDSNFSIQLGTVAAVLLGLLAVILVLPDGTDSDLAFSVFGLIVTGALAISSHR